MADIYFRTALSGYNKQDVMRFIEKLNCEQTERTNELAEQNRILNAEVRKLNDENKSFKERCAALEEKLREAEEKVSEKTEKADKYDDMQESFADLMLNAEREAQKKLEAAESEAQRIIESAREEIEAKKRELDLMKAEFSETFVENKRIIESSKVELTGVFEKICSSIETIYGKVSNACKRSDSQE